MKATKFFGIFKNRRLGDFVGLLDFGHLWESAVYKATTFNRLLPIYTCITIDVLPYDQCFFDFAR